MTIQQVGTVKRSKALAVGAAVAVAAVLAGFGIGYIARSGEVNTLSYDVRGLRRQVADQTERAEKVESKLSDRAAQKAADDAAAQRAAAEGEAAAAAEAARVAEEQRKQQEAAAAAAAAAAAEQQRQQAEADRLAQARRRIDGGDGIFQAGADIDPGRWKTDGGESCYYAILSDPSASGIDGIIMNNNVDGPAVVDVPAGRYLELSHCAAWYHE